MTRFQSDDFKITFSGGSVVIDVFNKATGEDTLRLVKIMVLVIVGFLFLFFRRWSGIIIPLCVVGSAMISTIGLMAATGTPISIMTNILPAFIVSVGITDSVHVLAIFYREYQNGRSKAEAFCHAMGHSGLPILMTSVTTAAGLLSFRLGGDRHHHAAADGQFSIGFQPGFGQAPEGHRRNLPGSGDGVGLRHLSAPLLQLHPRLLPRRPPGEDRPCACGAAPGRIGELRDCRGHPEGEWPL
jgi:hypothetical protein